MKKAGRIPEDILGIISIAVSFTFLLRPNLYDLYLLEDHKGVKCQTGKFSKCTLKDVSFTKYYAHKTCIFVHPVVDKQKFAHPDSPSISYAHLEFYMHTEDLLCALQTFQSG